MTLGEFLTSVANAIRNKKGTTGKINAANFADEIAGITTGSGGAVASITRRDVTGTTGPVRVEWSSVVDRVLVGCKYVEVYTPTAGNKFEANCVKVYMNGVEITAQTVGFVGNQLTISIPEVTGDIEIRISAVPD
jgi:hypothetical protein